MKQAKKKDCEFFLQSSNTHSRVCIFLWWFSIFQSELDLIAAAIKKKDIYFDNVNMKIFL